jgi:hypothetical protein
LAALHAENLYLEQNHIAIKALLMGEELRLGPARQSPTEMDGVRNKKDGPDGGGQKRRLQVLNNGHRKALQTPSAAIPLLNTAIAQIETEDGGVGLGLVG